MPTDYITPYDAPVIGSANNYTADVAAGSGFMSQASDFIWALPGAAVADVINSTGSIAKFLGADGWETNTEELIASYDRDAADYYRQNKGLVDGVELIATSLIPGTLGIKALRAAQTGAQGGKVLSTLGLSHVNPTTLNTARAAAAAKGERISATWNALGSEMNKALVLGVANQTLDMAAFSAAALVATNASPLYEGMSATDLVKNAAFDSLIFGGVVGGAFSAGKTFFTVKKAAGDADLKTLAARNADVGTEFDPAALRIAIAAQSYAKAAVANGGAILADTGAAIKSFIGTTAQSMVSAEDNLLMVAWGKFATRFAELPTESAQFFSKLTAVGRATPDEMGVVRLKGQQLAADITDGRMYGRYVDAPFHIGDQIPVTGSMQRGAVNEVKLGMGKGKADTIVKVTHDPLNAMQMQASYWHTADLAKLPNKPTKIATNNIPMMERAFEEASVELHTAGKTGIKFELPDGTLTSDMELVNKQIRAVKEYTARKLLQMGETPENVAARLNVHPKFLEAPDKNPWQLRSVSGKISGMESIKLHLESPRIVAVTYDIGTKVTAKGKEMKNTFARFDPSGKRSDDIFNAAMQGHIGVERLVTQPVKGANTAIMEQQAAAYIANVQKVNQEARAFVSTEVLPQLQSALPETALIEKVATDARRTTDTHTILKSASNDYDTLGAFLQKIGSMVKNAGDVAKKKVTEQLAHPAHTVANDMELGREWQLLNHKLGSTAANYVRDPSGAPRLIRQDIAINAKLMAEAEVAGKQARLVEALDGDEFITVSQRLMDDVIVPHTDTNVKWLTSNIKMSNQFMPGATSNAALEHGFVPMYRVPVDTSRYSNFLFVLDKHRLIGNGSGNAMLMAKDAEGLAAKKAALELEFPNRFEFVTKGGTKQYYKALGEYQYERGMNENFVDSTLRRTGKLADLVPTINAETNTLAGQELLAFHQRMAVREVRDAVELKYANAIQQLKFLGQQFDDLTLSRMTNEQLAKYEAKGIRNPFNDMINMALDKGSANEIPLWQDFNGAIERTGDKVFHAVRSGWQSLAEKTLSKAEMDIEVAALNKAAVGVGLEPLYSNMMYAQFKEQIPVRPQLRSFIARAQAGLNGLMLGTDFFQAINNMMGQVMFAAEFRSLIKQIEAGDARSGALKDLLKVQIPSTPYAINSVVKLNAQAIRRYLTGGKVWRDAGDLIPLDITKPQLGLDAIEKNGIFYARAAESGWAPATRNELRGHYKDEGLLTTVSEQYHQAVDDLTFSAKTLTDAELSAKWDKFLENARKVTGNKFAEELTRFIAADAARQITDVARSQGLIKSQAVASVYWNTAVNRVHGVNIASQRAIVFQGVVGQSIGMFMTYQHNLMQQLFRYAAEGNAPAMVALGASQFGLYGAQGLPAFNAVATHIIGNASGNREHIDPYTWVAKNMNTRLPGTGGTAAEWVLYGAGSNALGFVHPDLKVNIYSRGDINPRQLTVFPTSLENTVAYSATLGAVTSMFNIVDNVAQGAPVIESILHGIEHNNINRPLSGLGAVFQGAQTTAAGKKIGEVAGAETGYWLDKFNVSNFMRIAGAKPLDDAAAADAMYRTNAYRAKTTEDLRDLAESIRLSQVAGRAPSGTEMEKFMQDYAKKGGDIKNFRSFAVQTFKTANSNQVTELALKMRDSQSKQVAAIMGATHDEEWLAAVGLSE